MCGYFVGLSGASAVFLALSLHLAGVRDSKTALKVFRRIPKPILQFLALTPFAVTHDDESIPPWARRAYSWIGWTGIILFGGLTVVGLVLAVLCLL